MVMNAAWKMDHEGNSDARNEIAEIKGDGGQHGDARLDRVIQLYGAAGASELFRPRVSGATAAPPHRRWPRRSAPHDDRATRAAEAETIQDP